MSTTPHIFISAGEASGDLLASDLTQALLKQQSNLLISGMGGQLMQQAGVNIIQDGNEVALVGVIEIIKHLKTLRRVFNKIKNHLAATQPDLVILVDFPGFNLRLAKIAKAMGIKVLYFVSPQIWAWHYGRIKKIKQYVDHMAVLFQFEETLYQKENMPVSFVGHPLMQLVKKTASKEQLYQQYQLNPAQPIVALFPGSRCTEIERLLPIIRDTLPLIQARLPQTQFILPLANSLSIETLQPWLTPEMRIIENNTYNILQVCDAAIAASGTVTLEIALSRVPLVITYKLSKLTHLLSKLVVKVKNIGLCNIVAQEQVAKEFLQYRAKPSAIANETIKILTDHHYRQNILNKLDSIPSKLGDGHCANKTAALALRMLHN